MSYDDYNSVTSSIIDEYSSPIGGSSTKDSLFIFGTAQKGETGKPILANRSTVIQQYGDVPLDNSFDTSLVRGYLEVATSLKQNLNVYLVRVGNTKVARLDLYENNSTTSGGNSYTLQDGKPVVCMYIKSLIEGQEYNKAKVEILKDELTGNPNHIRIELPDGSYASFNLSLNVNTPGVITKVSDLVKAINNEASFAGKIRAYYVPLVEEIDLAITDDGNGNKNLIYDLDPEETQINESWGDKLIRIVKAYYEKDVVFNVPAGSSVIALPEVLEKNMNEGQAFDKVLYVYDKASLFSVDPLMFGQKTKSGKLQCFNQTGWDSAYSIKGSVEDEWNIKFYRKANGTTSFTEIPEFDVFTKTIVSVTGTTVVLNDVTGLSVNDKIAHAVLPANTTISSINVGAKSIVLSNPFNSTVYTNVALTIDQSGLNLSRTVASMTAGLNTFAVNDATDITVGMTVSGTNIPAGSVVTVVSGLNVTIDLAVNETYSAVGTSFVFTEAIPNWTVNITTADYVLNQTLLVGDQYFVSYKAKVLYAESKNRSDLKLGDPRNYFIFDTQVIFGAEQPSNLEVYYKATVNYESNDLVINNINKSIVEFTCPKTDLPEIGKSLKIIIEYEPELPAPTGTVLVGGIVQSASLSGGSDGRIIDKNKYVEAVVEGLKSVEIYPRRRNIIMGLWLDDVEMKPDYNTGLKSLQPLNGGLTIMPHIDQASRLSQECNVYIPVKPLTDFTQEAQNTWIDRLRNYSQTDPTRPANIIEGYTNFRADAPLGCFQISIPEINSGARYYANPACILAACQSSQPINESLINSQLPGNILNLGVKIFNAEIVGALNAKRYTLAKVDSTGRIVWADAPTLAPKNISKYDRQFVREVVFEAISVARSAAEPFIGKPYNAAYLSAMKNKVGKTVKDALLPAAGTGAISDLYVEISNPVNGSITGKSKLKLFITTSKEIRSIEIETSLQLGA